MQTEGIDRTQDEDVVIFGCIHSLLQELIVEQHSLAETKKNLDKEGHGFDMRHALCD